jgi:hypothetical protein
VGAHFLLPNLTHLKRKKKPIPSSNAYRQEQRLVDRALDGLEAQSSSNRR